MMSVNYKKNTKFFPWKNILHLLLHSKTIVMSEAEMLDIIKDIREEQAEEFAFFSV